MPFALAFFPSNFCVASFSSFDRWAPSHAHELTSHLHIFGACTFNVSSVYMLRAALCSLQHLAKSNKSLHVFCFDCFGNSRRILKWHEIRVFSKFTCHWTMLGSCCCYNEKNRAKNNRIHSSFSYKYIHIHLSVRSCARDQNAWRRHYARQLLATQIHLIWISQVVTKFSLSYALILITVAEILLCHGIFFSLSFVCFFLFFYNSTMLSELAFSLSGSPVDLCSRDRNCHY